MQIRNMLSVLPLNAPLDRKAQALVVWVDLRDAAATAREVAIRNAMLSRWMSLLLLVPVPYY